MTRSTHRPLRAAIRGAAALGCFVLTGCYSLRPIRLDGEIAPGRVRAHLSDSGAQRVAAPLGGARTVLDARLVSATPAEITLLVPSNTAAPEFGGEVLYQELRIPKDEIDGLQRRELDRVRTGVAVGLVGLVAGFLLYQSLSGKTGGTGDSGTGGPPEARIPIFRLILP